MYKVVLITPTGERVFETRGTQVTEVIKSAMLELVPGGKIEISIEDAVCPTCGKTLSDKDAEYDYGGCPDCFQV